jgi:small GTP-binding protein
VAVPRQADVADLTMMLWDMSGGEEFTQVRTSYLRGAAGAVLVGDLTRQETFDVLETYANDLYEISPKAQIILAANKCDLNGLQQLTEDQVKTFADALGAPYCLTSAKTGDAVETLFRDLGRLLVT